MPTSIFNRWGWVHSYSLFEFPARACPSLVNRMSLWSRSDGIRQLKSSRTHFFVIKKEKEKELYIINAVQADPFLPFSHLIL